MLYLTFYWSTDLVGDSIRGLFPKESQWSSFFSHCPSSLPHPWKKRQSRMKRKDICKKGCGWNKVGRREGDIPETFFTCRAKLEWTWICFLKSQPKSLEFCHALPHIKLVLKSTHGKTTLPKQITTWKELFKIFKELFHLNMQVMRVDMVAWSPCLLT